MTMTVVPFFLQKYSEQAESNFKKQMLSPLILTNKSQYLILDLISYLADHARGRVRETKSLYV
jgi:hypothetical protein